MKTFAVDSRTMTYQDEGQGPVLLMGHSYLWDSKMWAPQVEALSQSYRCIVPDLWAHGGSEFAPQSTRNLTDYAKQLLALMDHLEIDEFSVVGLSVGGMWGAELTALAPSRVKSLVMMDTFVGLEPEVTHKKYFTMLDAITQLKLVPQPVLDLVVPMFFSKNVKQTSPALVENFSTYLQSLKGEQAEEVSRMGRMIFGRRDLIEEVETFALPTLIAVGAEDSPRTPLESYLMNDVITGSELVVIPAAGHISNLEQPGFVTDMLKTFLAKVHQ
ncbi:alpha/beta hydrolase [Vibrionales bacterium C3R12]|nr:alpha/beta hydrolase [Vibrionales bacterium C3R12]